MNYEFGPYEVMESRGPQSGELLFSILRRGYSGNIAVAVDRRVAKLICISLALSDTYARLPPSDKELNKRAGAIEALANFHAANGET